MKWLKLLAMTALVVGLAVVVSAKTRPGVHTAAVNAKAKVVNYIEPLATLPIVPSNAVPYTPSPIDELDSIQSTVVGMTYFDYFSNGNTNRLIARDSLGGLHVCWMQSATGGANRTVYYNYCTPSHSWYNAIGQAVWTASPNILAGYCDIDVKSNGVAVVSAHRNGTTVPNHPYTAILGVDDGYQVGAFNEHAATYPTTSTSADSFIWPGTVIDLSDRAHMFAMDRSSGAFGHRFFYARSNPGIDSFPGGWSYHNMRTGTIGIYSASTRTGTNRVTAVWSNCMRPYDNLGNISTGSAQAENDVYYVDSYDGGTTWNWDNPTNVTRFLGWSDTLFATSGDTVLAGRDTFRAYNDNCAIFDNQNRLHIVFMTQAIYDRPSSTGDSVDAYYGYSASMLWHWCEDRPNEFDWVGDGWWRFMGNQSTTTVATAELAWQKTLSRPCLSIGTDGTMYCVWTQFDRGDYAANGLPCGDIVASKSVNNGSSWYFPTYITQTGNDSTTATGSANNEMFASCQETVTNDTLYVMYVNRKDGGVAVNALSGTTPVYTQNPVVVAAVPTSWIRSDSLLYMADSNRFSAAEIGQRPSMWSNHPHVLGVNNPTAATKIPDNFRIVGNYPNPFNPTTDIVFALDKARNIQLAVYDVNGREVAKVVSGNFTAGRHSVTFDGSKFSSGVYFARLTANGISQTQKITLLK